MFEHMFECVNASTPAGAPASSGPPTLVRGDEGVRVRGQLLDELGGCRFGVDLVAHRAPDGLGCEHVGPRSLPVLLGEFLVVGSEAGGDLGGLLSVEAGEGPGEPAAPAGVREAYLARPT